MTKSSYKQTGLCLCFFLAWNFVFYLRNISMLSSSVLRASCVRIPAQGLFPIPPPSLSLSHTLSFLSALHCPILIKAKTANINLKMYIYIYQHVHIFQQKMHLKQKKEFIFLSYPKLLNGSVSQFLQKY